MDIYPEIQQAFDALSDEQKERAKRYAGKKWFHTEMVKITVWENYDDFGGSLDEVIQFFVDLKESVPPEYRDKCSVTYDWDYDTSPDFYVSYKRPQTLEEAMVHFHWVVGHVVGQIAADRVHYEKLKAKFEGADYEEDQ